MSALARKTNKSDLLKKVLIAILPGLIVVGFLVFANPTQRASITAPVESGLVGYWNMDSSDIYGSTLYDKSGYANHATIYGATTTTGKIKQALSFDGVDDYVEVSTTTDSVLDITEAITLSAWVFDPPIEKEKSEGVNSEVVELTILNPNSHPQAGENWIVSFTTRGTADLKITPIEEASVNDLSFTSLTCNEEERTPQILEQDVIFYPDWACGGTGRIIHLVNVTGKHTLKFQFGDQTAYAYNSPDTEILRPNAAGDKTEWTIQYPTSGEHWDKVNEETADDDGTYIKATGVESSGYDYYNLPAHTGSGGINKIRLHYKARSSLESGIKMYGVIKTYDTEYTTGGIFIYASWWPRYYDWSTNPKTAAAWTWSEVDALQAGVYIFSSDIPSGHFMQVTQVYVEVDYTPIPTIVGKGRDAYALEIDDSLNVTGYISGSASGATTITKAWHHVVMTYDRQNIKLYIDGALKDSYATTSAINTNSTNLKIGDLVPGKIDDVRIYNRALLASEVSQNYNSAKRAIIDTTDEERKTIITPASLDE